ncbi:MAG: pentapeptide repeat-containing protein [Candidatus Thiodiazotropha sp. DIVDIV]
MNKQSENSPQVWFVKHEGLVSGPVTASRIRQLLLDGALDLSDQISLDQQEWQQILQVPSVVPLQLRADSGDKDAIARIEARAQTRNKERARIGRVPVLPLTVLTVVLGAALLISLLIGMPDQIDTPQCDQPPAPGINWRNCLLVGIDVGSASLAGANMNSAVLRQGKFSATNLNGVDLSYADMRQADLRYAQMQQSLLVGTNLQGVDLRDADLSNSDLQFADLSGSRIGGVLWSGARLDNAIWFDGRTCGEKSIGQCR